MSLQEKIKQFPLTPGIYLMKDSLGNIIYVGKSKQLRTRVQSYFQPSRQVSRKIENLTYNVKDIDYIETDTEFEALLLECQYIHELKPRYNSLMKNPSRYCYITIDEKERWPSIDIVPTLSQKGNQHYFGPFSNRNAVERALQGVKEHFKIDCLHFPQRKGPCLNYSLGQCMGLCIGKYHEEYRQIILQIIKLFQGKNSSLINELEKAMENFAKECHYEKAAKYRDHLNSLRSLLRQERAIEFIKGDKKIAVFEPLQDNSFKFFLIQGNQVLERKKYSLSLNQGESVAADRIVQTILSFQLNGNTKPQTRIIGKEGIDEAQIIYQYLQNGNCYYFQLDEGQFLDIDITELKEKIHQFIASIV